MRKFNNISLVDIREYYIDKASGEARPGKKGISLTEDSWNILLENQLQIQSALDRMAGRSSSGSGLKGKLQAIPVDAKELPPLKKPRKEPASKKAASAEEKTGEETNQQQQEQNKVVEEKPAKKAKKEKAKKVESEEDSDFDDIDDIVKELESEED